MKIIKEIFRWIKKNKEWLFSGIGITILSLFFAVYNQNKDKVIDENSTSDYGNNIEINGYVSGDIYIKALSLITIIKKIMIKKK